MNYRIQINLVDSDLFCDIDRTLSDVQYDICKLISSSTLIKKTPINWLFKTDT